MTGPNRPDDGLRFDSSKLLLDPYAREVVDDDYDRTIASQPDAPNAAAALRGVVTDPDAYDWGGDEPLRRTLRGGAIYELHVRGFTNHPNSGLRGRLRGTYAGVIEKIPYLQQLGIDAVELLPVFHFDRQSAPEAHRRGGRIPRHGQGAAPRRHRGDPGCGLQPHRRGWCVRSDAVDARHRQPHVLPAGC